MHGPGVDQRHAATRQGIDGVRVGVGEANVSQGVAAQLVSISRTCSDNDRRIGVGCLCAGRSHGKQAMQVR